MKTSLNVDICLLILSVTICFAQKCFYILQQQFQHSFWPIQCAVTPHPVCCNSPSTGCNWIVKAYGWGVTAHLMGQNLMPELLLEDVETFLGLQTVTGNISRQRYTFPEVFIFQWNLSLRTLTLLEFIFYGDVNSKSMNGLIRNVIFVFFGGTINVLDCGTMS